MVTTSTYAVVTAKISERLAFVNPLKHTDSSKLKTAMIANRAGIGRTKYRIMMDEASNNEAKILVSQYVILKIVLS